MIRSKHTRNRVGMAGWLCERTGKYTVVIIDESNCKHCAAENASLEQARLDNTQREERNENYR